MLLNMVMKPNKNYVWTSTFMHVDGLWKMYWKQQVDGNVGQCACNKI